MWWGDLAGWIPRDGGGYSAISGYISPSNAPDGSHYFVLWLTSGGGFNSTPIGMGMWGGRSDFRDSPLGVYTREWGCDSGPETLIVLPTRH
jgi:hypothetical protein